MASAAKKSKSETIDKGLVVIVDKINKKEKKKYKNVDAITQLFEEHLNCDVKTLDIENRKGNKHWEDVQNIVTDAAGYRFVVIFVLQVSKADEQTQLLFFKKYFEKFIGVENVKDTPKLFIQHVLSQADENAAKPPARSGALYNLPEKSMFIRSVVINATEGEDHTFNHIESSFLESLRNIFGTDERHLGIIDLITKVLEVRELRDYFKTKDSPQSETATQQATQVDGDRSTKIEMFEEVTFSTKLDNTFQLVPGDASPGSTFTFADTRVSKTDMKRLLSLKIELKEQKIPEYLLDQHYYMDHKSRGFCIIINQTGERAGAYIDELRLVQLFKEELLFEIEVIRNKTHDEIRNRIKQIVNEIKDSHQCLFVFLMAHGCQYKDVKKNGSGTPSPNRSPPPERHDITEGTDTEPSTDRKSQQETSKISTQKNGTNGDHVFYDILDKPSKSDYIFSSFGAEKCPHLENKPKVFVLQTCFGGNVMNPCGDEGKENESVLTAQDIHSLQRAEMHMRHDDGGNGNGKNGDITDEKPPYPTIAMNTGRGQRAAHDTSDTIWLNATLPGFRSHRNILYGTELIQFLDQAFRQKAAVFDITHLITAVISLVSKKEFHGKQRQQPVTKEHTLKSFLFLNPGFIREPDCSLPSNGTTRSLTGSVIWPTVTDHLMLINVDHHGTCQFKLVQIKKVQPEVTDLVHATADSQTPATNGNGALNHITNGIMLDEKRHLVIADKDEKSKKAVIVSVDKIAKTWKVDKEDTELPVPMNNPIALCTINIDGFGILRGAQRTTDAQFEVYTRKPIIEPQDNKTKKQPIQTEISLRLNYGTISYFDKCYYKKTKLFILNYYECTVSQFNMNGGQEFVVGNPAVPKRPLVGGELLNPCAVIGNSDTEKYRCTQLVVACCNAIHTANIKPDADDENEPWTVTWDEPKPVDKMDKIDKIDGIWYDKNNMFIVKDNLIDCTKIDINENYFKKINNKPKKDLKDGWLRQTMWSTEANELVLGGAQATDITLLDPDKQEIKYTVNPMKHGRVISGLCTKPGTHVIVAGDDPDQVRRKQHGMNGNGVPKQWIVNLDTEKNEISKTQGVNHRKRNLYPISLFTVDGDKYGVLCAEKEVSEYAYIELRKKDENVLKWTLRVHHKNVSVNDSVCVDQKGEFYVSSFKTGKVQKFDKQGKPMALLGNGNGEGISRGIDTQFNLEQPYKLFLARDGNLVVQCIDAMFKYEDGKWNQVSGFCGRAWDMCCLGKKVYTIYKDEFMTWDIVDIDAQQPSTSSQSKRPLSPNDSPSIS